MIYIDMIAFYLQKAGGITVVWKELITRMIRDELNVTLILQNRECNNIFFDEIMEMSPRFIIEKNKNDRFQRYLPVDMPFSKEDIFVSTYYRIPKNKEIRQFTIVHDFTYEYYVKGIKRIIHSWQKKQSVKSSQIIVCVSNNTKKDLLKFYPWAQKKKIYVIYNGVSEVYRPLEKKERIDELEKYNDEPFFLFVGSRATYKRFDFAVEIAKHEKKALVIVGGGKLNQHEKKYLDKELKGSYIQLLGVSDEKLNKIYNCTECLLYPSEYEGFGIPIIEAQKSGCPVLAKKGSSVSEIVNNSSILLEKYDIEDAINIIDVFYKMPNIKRTVINVEKYSWEETYHNYRIVMNCKEDYKK